MSLQNIYYKNLIIPLYCIYMIKNYRFAFSDVKNWKNHLQTQGFVVIASYIGNEQCKKLVNQTWDIIEYLSQGKVKKNQIDTQSVAKNYPFTLHGGMIQYIAHSQIQWNLRKKCKRIFEVIWNQKDLKSSFDGFCFMNGRRNYQKRPDNSFLHCDQSPMRNHLWSYQGLIALTNNLENEGGFVVVPKSNHYHHKYFEDKKLLSLKSDWYLVPDEDKNKFPLTDCLKIDNLAGDFILWDSRTFHCNTVPKKDNLRICFYICMIPTSKIPEKILKKRKQAAQKKRTSNHYPGQGFKLFPILPRYVTDRQQFLQLVEKINDFDTDKEIQALI